MHHAFCSFVRMHRQAKYNILGLFRMIKSQWGKKTILLFCVLFYIGYYLLFLNQDGYGVIKTTTTTNYNGGEDSESSHTRIKTTTTTTTTTTTKDGQRNKHHEQTVEIEVDVLRKLLKLVVAKKSPISLNQEKEGEEEENIIDSISNAIGLPPSPTNNKSKIRSGNIQKNIKTTTVNSRKSQYLDIHKITTQAYTKRRIIASLPSGGGSRRWKKKNIKTKAERKCVVPKLDPFHKDVLPYLDYTWRENVCTYKPVGYVTDGGVLNVDLKNVQRIGYYYIRWNGDDDFSWSDYHHLKHEFTLFLQKGLSFCLLRQKRDDDDDVDEILVFGTTNSSARDGDGDGNVGKLELSKINTKDGCDKENHFKHKQRRILHLNSGKCFVRKEDNVELSQDIGDCLDNKESMFDIIEQDGTIKHVASGQCVSNSLKLVSCDDAAVFQPYRGNKFDYGDYKDKVQLTEDYIRLVYKKNEKITNEYFMYPLKKKKKKKKKDEEKASNTTKSSKDANKLNVVMLMVDSLSHAGFQRYLNATYQAIKQDKSSVIMNGHTINGDGTLAQLLAILTGKAQKDLPDARRNSASRTVDAFPFIFKDYKSDGYVTMFSEERPEISAFNYRLNGFANPPVDKYLRPWWQAAKWNLLSESSLQCYNNFTFDYLKNFLKVYRDDRKWVFLSTDIGHDEINAFSLLDGNLHTFFQNFKNSDDEKDTILFIFGDHGHRLSDFRATLQGKLEERLPFLSVSFPDSFHKKYAQEIQNLKKNANSLTTHFDFHRTLQHIRTFPSPPKNKHKFGQSLFTDIYSRDRHCEKAGISEHWCPCVSYVPIDVSDRVALFTALASVRHINEDLNKETLSKENCLELKLKAVLRAGRRTVNKAVETFVKTVETSDCDTCEIVNDSSNLEHQSIYEIAFQVSPSDGKFEVTVTYDEDKDTMIHISQISRLNRYGRQPDCIKSHPRFGELRKFCFCENNL